MNASNGKDVPAAVASAVAAAGAAPQNPNVVQVNPAEVAQMTLAFLQRCDMKPAERQTFGICEQFLQAIAAGRVVLVPVPEGAKVATVGAGAPPVAAAA